jgi:hypothetical protein
MDHSEQDTKPNHEPQAKGMLMRPRLTWANMIVAGAIVAWGWFFVSVETFPPFLLADAGIFLGLCLVLLSVTRRWLLAFSLNVLFFLSIYVSSGFKYSILAMNLHVYDVSFYLSYLTQIRFFYETFPRIAYPATFAFLLLVAALIALYRFERPWGANWKQRSGVTLAALLLLAGSLRPLFVNNVDFFSDGRLVFSAFFSSLRDIPELLKFNKVFESSAQANAGPIPLDAISCSPDKTPPNIILFLNESAMPPGVYPNLIYPQELDPFYKSYDGQIHPLRVETFGGGTWLSDFSALTGLSTNSFGSMRNFAIQIMTGRLRHSLPQYLKACGYETSIVYPSGADFAGSANFYKAIGFDHIIDRKVHHAQDDRQRDAFYYEQVRQVFERAKNSGSTKPQFVAAQSMSTHTPWDFRFAQDAVKPGEELRWNRDVEFDEYLWRLVLAKRDRDDFRAQLAEQFPNAPFLFVGYGDHQPALSKIPIDDPVAIADGGKSWQLDPTAPAFRTYYSVDALNFTPQINLPEVPIVEIPHLATIAVQAAGLPLDPVFRQRAQLLKTCNGLFGTCADKGALLTFQHWLVDAGWVTAGR